MTITDYENMTDEEIVALAQPEKVDGKVVRAGDSGAEEFLLNKYKTFVLTKARNYFIVGADHEDIVQEGMIGLFKAIRDYRPDRLASFRAFAEICVIRQMYTAIKTATRQKHIPLNNSVSLNKPMYEEDSGQTLMDTIVEDEPNNPEEMFIDREDFSVTSSKLYQMLSDLEREVMFRFVEGKSYNTIAEELNVHAKCVDNAIQRIKRKATRYILERDTQNEK